MEAKNLESQTLEFACTICTTTRHGISVPLAYKNQRKLDKHFTSEKHLVNSGQVIIEGCIACCRDFKTNA